VKIIFWKDPYSTLDEGLETLVDNSSIKELSDYLLRNGSAEVHFEHEPPSPPESLILEGPLLSLSPPQQVEYQIDSSIVQDQITTLLVEPPPTQNIVDEEIDDRDSSDFDPNYYLSEDKELADGRKRRRQFREGNSEWVNVELDDEELDVLLGSNDAANIGGYGTTTRDGNNAEADIGWEGISTGADVGVDGVST
ncbi:hypothetical protein CFOL_v3_01155, partial [Cephalotus follicularis]